MLKLIADISDMKYLKKLICQVMPENYPPAN